MTYTQRTALWTVGALGPILRLPAACSSALFWTHVQPCLSTGGPTTPCMVTANHPECPDGWHNAWMTFSWVPRGSGDFQTWLVFRQQNECAFCFWIKSALVEPHFHITGVQINSCEWYIRRLSDHRGFSVQNCPPNTAGGYARASAEFLLFSVWVSRQYHICQCICCPSVLQDEFDVMIFPQASLSKSLLPFNLGPRLWTGHTAQLKAVHTP